MALLSIQLNYVVVLDNFFLLSVLVSLKKRKKEKKNREEIHGGSGSTWGDNFYMGTQNGSKLEI